MFSFSFFLQASVVATGCFKGRGVSQKTSSRSRYQKIPLFFLVLSHVLYVFRGGRAPPLCAHNNLFIRHNKRAKRPLYARRAGRLSALYMFDGVILPFLTTQVKTSAIQRRPERERGLTRRHFARSIEPPANTVQPLHTRA